MTISPCLVLLALLSSAPVQGASAPACELAPEIRSQAAKVQVTADPPDFDQNVGPVLALRQRYPDNLLVHELYQDAVYRHGVEGHLQRLTEEYQVLSMQHAGELMYEYLYARSLMGRNTGSAIRQINELLAEHPDFFPAHRALAEIYASAAFRDGKKEKVERERLLQLCPGAVLQQRPGSLPEPSPLVDQAERLLASNADPDRILAMARQGVRDDEWRLQRIRPFDWYSVEDKRQSQRQLQSKYWRMWSLEVRCDRRAGHPEKSAALLAAMDQRAEVLARHSDPGYWDAMAMLVRLYEEGNQKESATQKIGSMQQFLAQHPDPQHAVQLEELRTEIAERKD